MMNFHNIRNNEKSPFGSARSSPSGPAVQPNSFSGFVAVELSWVVELIRSTSLAKVAWSAGQPARCMMDSKVVSHNLHLVDEQWGINERVARPLWRMHLNHVCVSLLVVSDEWMSLAISLHGGVAPGRGGQAFRHVGGASWFILKSAVSLLTVSLSS